MVWIKLSIPGDPITELGKRSGVWTIVDTYEDRRAESGSPGYLSGSGGVVRKGVRLETPDDQTGRVWNVGCWLGRTSIHADLIKLVFGMKVGPGTRSRDSGRWV